MTTVAILCSGQGFQDETMFDLTANLASAEPIFAAARAHLNDRDPRDIARSGGDALHVNATAQILCCTQALAAWAALGPRVDARLVVAGYSVGELSAWGVAGLFDAQTVLEIAAERAKAMDAATDEPSGLAAVRGLSRRTLGDLCASHGAYIAIVNAPDQIVIGGASRAIDRVLADAQDKGATRVTHLPVAVPSHTPILKPAADQLRAFLAGRAVTASSGARLLSGIDGEPVFDTGSGLDKLALQVARTIDWQACMDGCRAAAATRALELGPGRALARLMGEVIGEGQSRSVADFRTIDGVARWLSA